MPEISVLCGLGNPEKDYRGTRHNLGKETLDVLAVRHHLEWIRQNKILVKAVLCSDRGRVTLIKPLTFVNCSGEVFSHLEIGDCSEVMIITDDMSIPLGRIRFRESGGSGGHRGLESIVESLGTEDFPRMRIGVGSPPDSRDWKNYVLSPFSPQEAGLAERMKRISADAAELALREGLERAMQEYNGEYFGDE